MYNFEITTKTIISYKIFILYRLIVGSSFDSNFRNRLDLTISTLEIDLKLNLISIILELTRLDSTRFLILILGIESNCQEIKNNIIILRFSIFRYTLL